MSFQRIGWGDFGTFDGQRPFHHKVSKAKVGVVYLDVALDGHVPMHKGLQPCKNAQHVSRVADADTAIGDIH